MSIRVLEKSIRLYSRIVLLYISTSTRWVVYAFLAGVESIAVKVSYHAYMLTTNRDCPSGLSHQIPPIVSLSLWVTVLGVSTSVYRRNPLSISLNSLSS
jgi:hypothetical protein